MKISTLQKTPRKSHHRAWYFSQEDIRGSAELGIAIIRFLGVKKQLIAYKWLLLLSTTCPKKPRDLNCVLFCFMILCLVQWLGCQFIILGWNFSASAYTWLRLQEWGGGWWWISEIITIEEGRQRKWSEFNRSWERSLEDRENQARRGSRGKSFSTGKMLWIIS